MDMDLHNTHSTTQIVAWDKICKPQNGGGISTKKTEDVNTTFPAKQCWNIITQSDNISVKLIEAKYLKNSMNFLSCNKHNCFHYSGSKISYQEVYGLDSWKKKIWNWYDNQKEDSLLIDKIHPDMRYILLIMAESVILLLFRENGIFTHLSTFSLSIL